MESEEETKIKVIGVGDAGGNAIDNMIDANLQGAEFIVANTDVTALKGSKAAIKLQLGAKSLGGVGAGMNPNVGREAALESASDIRTALAGSDLVFIVAGLGGGNGTGAAPVIAKICMELQALTIAVVTTPFSFEGEKRAKQAEDGIAALKEITDAVFTIANDRLHRIATEHIKMAGKFIKADEILLHAVKGIMDLIMIRGVANNIGLAEIRMIMSKPGIVLMGIGIAKGGAEAAERALSYPLMEDVSTEWVKSVLIHFTCSSDITLDEMNEAFDRIYLEVGDDAEIIWDLAIDESLGDEMRIIVIMNYEAGKDYRMWRMILDSRQH